jgi:predicted phosphodiesterase
MRIAVISDMHGNCVALDAVLDDLRGDQIDRIVCLGDAVQGGPQPAEVVWRLRELGCPVVMGNADAWLLSGAETGSEDISAERLRKMAEARAWSLAQISTEDRGFIAGFQPTVELPLGAGRNLLCFHGSPASFDEVILPTTPEAEFQRMLSGHIPNILTGGHTHMQQIRRIGTSDAFFFNPGSVGFAYSHQQEEHGFRADPWAEYAVLTADGGRIALELRRIPFDVERLIAVYQASGRPHAAEAIGQYQASHERRAMSDERRGPRAES